MMIGRGMTLRNLRAGLPLLLFGLVLSCARQDPGSDEDTAGRAAQAVAGADEARESPAPPAPPPATDATVIPELGPRSYSRGQALVKVSGALEIDARIPLAPQESTGDGQITWLQYGEPVAEEPSALVTVSAEEIGLTVSRGNDTVTTAATECSGDLKAGPPAVSGRYSCNDVPYYDAASGEKRTVRLEIAFEAE